MPGATPSPSPTSRTRSGTKRAARRSKNACNGGRGVDAPRPPFPRRKLNRRHLGTTLFAIPSAGMSPADALTWLVGSPRFPPNPARQAGRNLTRTVKVAPMPRLLAFLVLPALLTLSRLPTVRADEKPTAFRHGLVVAVSPEGADVGLGILKKGGNAVDAAVATAFAM